MDQTKTIEKCKDWIMQQEKLLAETALALAMCQTERAMMAIELEQLKRVLEEESD